MTSRDVMWMFWSSVTLDRAIDRLTGYTAVLTDRQTRAPLHYTSSAPDWLDWFTVTAVYTNPVLRWTSSPDSCPVRMVGMMMMSCLAHGSSDGRLGAGVPVATG